MPDHKLLSLAAALRARVEEVLAQAETMKDADAQRKICGVAAAYEKLAQRLEQHARDLDEVTGRGRDQSIMRPATTR
jgi:hypothetical protein